MRKTLLIASLLAAVAGAASAAPAANSNSGNAARGKQLYFQHGCYGCHGYQGQTGARNLVGTNSPILKNPQTFVFFLRQRGGFLPMIPSTAMPRFSEKAIPDPQALDIFAFIQSLKLDAPALSSIPLMAQIEASAARDYPPAK